MDESQKKEVNVRPHSVRPLWLSNERWQELVSRTKPSWSMCASEEEWLAKLKYLRAGQDKLSDSDFQERELRLVRAWVMRPGARARR